MLKPFDIAEFAYELGQKHGRAAGKAEAQEFYENLVSWLLAQQDQLRSALITQAIAPDPIAESDEFNDFIEDRSYRSIYGDYDY